MCFVCQFPAAHSPHSCVADYPVGPELPKEAFRTGVAPRKPQPVGGAGGADPAVIAGTASDGIAKHKTKRVTQGPGGDSTFRLG